MPLDSGTKLGPYEIVAPLGAGGMGEVYRARDAKLNREVAIKILPAALSNDAQYMARFEREAQMLAALNHPNIATVYGIEQGALVMELVEGADLKGPLPLDEALAIAKQIATGLEAAHEKNIIHRDLKPANIKLTPAGVVKILDFGLAKSADTNSAPASGSNPTVSPTLSMHMTQAGMILGTAAYMSPEQARGKVVDRRTDIWAFGVVLYEIVTGKRLFEGEDLTETLASVVKEQPALDSLPAQIRRIVARCLEKDARQRWQAIGDVRIEIEALLANPDGVSESGQPTASRPLWRRATPILVTAILALGAGGVTVWNLKPSARPPVSRFTVALGEEQHFTSTGRPVVAISPDGTQMVYVANNRLYLRPMAELEARAIPGSEGSIGVANAITNPVLSPDGRFIAYWDRTAGALKRIAVTGGAAVTICPASNPDGMSWDGSGIVFGQASRGILRVSENGGTPELLAAAKGGEIAAQPRMLPGGKAVMFTLAPGANEWDKTKIVVQTLKSGARKTLVEGGGDARYLPTGHLVYFLGGTLLAVPFDPSRLEVTGGPVPLAEGIWRTRQIGAAQFDFSNTGSMIYVPGPSFTSANRQYSLAIRDGKGTVEALKLPPADYDYPRVSRDGKRLAYQTDDGKDSIVWIYDLSGANAPRRLTFQGANRYPVWSADGERVAFQSDREGDLGIFWQRADGTGTAERLTKPEKGVAHIPDSFSPDGQQLSFTAVQGDKMEVWTLSLRDRKATLFANSPSGRAEASVFSPDGRWLAYRAGQSGTVFVRPFPVTPGQYQIAAGGHPVWSRDGKRLIFETGAITAATVNITAGKSFAFSSPASMPKGLDGAAVGPTRWDILPDGRLVGITPAVPNQTGAPATPPIQVVLNWFEDVKQRAPVSK